jgi:hypothetical protein
LPDRERAGTAILVGIRKPGRPRWRPLASHPRFRITRSRAATVETTTVNARAAHVDFIAFLRRSRSYVPKRLLENAMRDSSSGSGACGVRQRVGDVGRRSRPASSAWIASHGSGLLDVRRHRPCAASGTFFEQGLRFYHRTRSHPRATARHCRRRPTFRAIR